MKKVTVFFCAMLFVFATLTSASALILYDNTTNDAMSSLAFGAFQWGDEITLFPDMDATVTQFTFGYYLREGSGTGTIRFYDNTGTDGAPNNLLFTSIQFPLSSGHQDQTFSGLSVAVPGTFTWSVHWNLTSTSDVAFLEQFNPPTVGSSDPSSMWLQNVSGGSWSELSIEPKPLNFKARVEGVPVPEPATVLLLGTGLVGLVGFRKKFKK